jgi:hypothetical protein
VSKKAVLIGAAAGLVAVVVLTQVVSGEPPITTPYVAVFTVKDADTGALVGGARVVFDISCGGASSTTNSSGQCSIGLAAPGTFVFDVSAPGYVTLKDQEFTFAAGDLA